MSTMGIPVVLANEEHVLGVDALALPVTNVYDREFEERRFQQA